MTTEDKDGEWVTVPTYAGIMGITNSRVYQKIRFGSLHSVSLSELAKTNWKAYSTIGRVGNCCIVVWLSDDDEGNKKGGNK